MTLGRCKHGTFALTQGCSQCIEEKVMAIAGEKLRADDAVVLNDEGVAFKAKARGKELLPEGGLAEAAQAAGAEVTVAKVNYKMEPETETGGTKMTIKEQVNIVVEAREKAKEAKKARHDAQVAWEESNASLFEAAGYAAGECASAEDKLRELALEIYAVTGDKAVFPGIGIRVLTKLGYDGKEAMEWAMEHSLALTLDKKSFEAIAKTTPLNFVVSIEEPVATIAQDLNKIT